MKTSYHSYNKRVWRAQFPAMAGMLTFLFAILPLLLASAAALGAPMKSGDDTILQGPRPGPCAGASDGADYIGGADATGHYVTPADLGGTAAVQLDSETVLAEVPIGAHGQSAQVAVEVKGLRAGLAAPSACRPHSRQRRDR